MRFGWVLHVFAFFLVLILASGRAAHADELTEKAELWGQMHGHSIYCRMTNSHEFGLRVVRYLRRHASGERYERVRDKYGLKILDHAQQPPTRALGGECGAFRNQFMEIYEELK